MALGIPLGVLIGTSKWAHRVSWPILLFFQAIGDIAWLPILLIWFGFGLDDHDLRHRLYRAVPGGP